nr:hypothetical protein [Candidatus Baldrarchaeota archaeon]
MNCVERSPGQLLRNLSSLIKKIVETVLSEYPDDISTRHRSLETYFPSAETFFKEYLNLTERLKLWFKVRMQLYNTIKGLVKTMDTVNDNLKATAEHVQALILPEYKRLLDLLLEDLRFAKEVSSKLSVLEIINENCRKAGIRAQLHLKISGYDIDEHTDDIEKALTKISEGNLEEAEKLITKLRERLKQLQYG